MNNNQQSINNSVIKTFTTRYLGSKVKLIDWLWENTKDYKFDSIFDAFAGTNIVGYMYKQKGKKIISNDFLSFNYYAAKAIIENNNVVLSVDEIKHLLEENTNRENFIEREYTNVFFPHEDTIFLDSMYQHFLEEENEYKKALIMTATCQAILKKAPYGRFTTTTMSNLGKKTMKQYFIEMITEFNACVFDNHQENMAFNKNTLNLANHIIADSCYIDTPYGGKSFSKYEHFYNFVELYCNYWQYEEMIGKLKQVQKRDSVFSYGKKHEQAFSELFEKIQHIPLWFMSYNNNGGLSMEQILNMIRMYKKDVKVITQNYTYANKLRSYEEYLIIGR